MYGRYSIIAGLIVQLLPIVVYMFRIRIRLRDMNWGVVISGLLSTLCMVFIGGWSSPFGFVMYYIWMIVLPILITVHAVIWIVGTVKKRNPYVSGMVMTGVVPLISGLLLNNWITVALAIIYLFITVRAAYGFIRNE